MGLVSSILSMPNLIEIADDLQQIAFQYFQEICLGH